MKTKLALLSLSVAAALVAQQVVPVRWMLQTDGLRVYPDGILANQAEVTTVKASADSLQGKVDANAASASALSARVETLAEQIADATVDGAWALSLFCPAVGFAVKTSDGTSRIQWTKVATPSDKTGAFIADKEIDLSRLTIQVGSPLDVFMANPQKDTTATVTANGTGTFPDGTAGWKYAVAFEEVPGAVTGFYKLVYDDELVVGQGNFFPVVGGLSVDGAMGRTVTVQATDEAGNPVTLTFKGGLLVEELAQEVTE